MAFKGEAKKLYQRQYMKGYMQRHRADVKTPLRPKMGFEPKVRALLDADGNVIPEDFT